VQAGGEVTVTPGDASGLKVAEPFFVVRAGVATPPGVALLHGLTGRIRYTLASEPLLRQWLRSLRQLIQKRYES
jgi:putative peptide zinc metalloprotease protein